MRAWVGALAISGLIGAGCGNDDPGTHFCVGDKTASNECTVSWELTDPCSLAPSSASVELALFDDECPEDAVLLGGDTSAAVYRAAFTPGQSFAPIEGLDTKSYGFAFVARDANCAVTAFGCTDANLAVITTIRTAVCDWSGSAAGAPSCECTPAAGGGCPLGRTCTAGVCSD